MDWCCVAGGLLGLVATPTRSAAVGDRRPRSWLQITRCVQPRRDYNAEVGIIDPTVVQDHAAFEQPHRYANGVRHAQVIGTAVLEDSEHSGATLGRVARGPVWRGSFPR